MIHSRYIPNDTFSIDMFEPKKQARFEPENPKAMRLWPIRTAIVFLNGDSLFVR